jgi:hypothetical protein
MEKDLEGSCHVLIKVIFQLPEGTEEDNENPQHSQRSGQAPCEYKSRALLPHKLARLFMWVGWISITEAEDGFESDSEREESSEEEEDVEKLQLQQHPAKPVSRHSTRRSSQQQQLNEDTGSHSILKQIFLFWHVHFLSCLLIHLFNA